MITREALAKELEVSVVTIDRWRKKGLPFSKPFGAVRFDLEDVKAWMKENGNDESK